MVGFYLYISLLLIATLLRNHTIGNWHILELQRNVCVLASWNG